MIEHPLWQTEAHLAGLDRDRPDYLRIRPGGASSFGEIAGHLDQSGVKPSTPRVKRRTPVPSAAIV